MSTALEDFERLESTGLWRPAGAAQRREVLVALGRESLVIMDMNETPIVHWALGDVEQRSASQNGPAVYAPRGFESEVLEIEDPVMIEAIDRLQRRLGRARRRRGRVRRVLFASALVAACLATLFVLPAALRDQAVRIVPEVSKRQIGSQMLDQLALRLGQPCEGEGARTVLAALVREVTLGRSGASAGNTLGAGIAGDGPVYLTPRVVVLPQVPGRLMALPGKIWLIDRRVIEEEDGPDPLIAGLTALAEAQTVPPFRRLLEDAGPLEILRLLATGKLPEKAISQHLEKLIQTPRPPLDPARLADLARAGRIDRVALSRALAHPVLSDFASLPAGIETMPPEHLDDRSWLILQNICRE